MLEFADVFPAGSDPIPDGDVSWAGGFNSLPCKLCGALVIQSGQDRHVGFHNALEITKD